MPSEQRYKRVQVLFSKEQYEIIKMIRKKLGLNSDSETVKVIVLSWLAEKSLISSFIKGNLITEVDEYEGQKEG